MQLSGIDSLPALNQARLPLNWAMQGQLFICKTFTAAEANLASGQLAALQLKRRIYWLSNGQMPVQQKQSKHKADTANGA